MVNRAMIELFRPAARALRGSPHPNGEIQLSHRLRSKRRATTDNSTTQNTEAPMINRAIIELNGCAPPRK